MIWAMGLLAALIGGAIIGSFLTVLVVRIPRILLAGQDGQPSVTAVLSGISWPGSHCTACDMALTWRDNVPLLSYVHLRGRCRTCRTPYGLQYLMLESVSALAAALCVALFGWTAEAAFCFTLLITLIALTVIDMNEQLLPDVLVLPLLPLGLLFQARYRAGLFSALEGAAIGYLVMWTIGTIYRLYAKRDGMGFGDIKIAAVLGAWLGAAAVPLFLMGAFAAGTLATLPLVLLGRLNAKNAVPFGPFLCLSAAIFVLIPSMTEWSTTALFSL